MRTMFTVRGILSLCPSFHDDARDDIADEIMFRFFDCNEEPEALCQKHSKDVLNGSPPHRCSTPTLSDLDWCNLNSILLGMALRRLVEDCPDSSKENPAMVNFEEVNFFACQVSSLIFEEFGCPIRS